MYRLIRSVFPAIFSLLGVSFGHAQDSSAPNILFAFADDWGRYASVYGDLEPGGPNDVVQTPHFDRVAREGVLFTNAYVNAPSCTPCRSSLLSGRPFWQCGRGAILQGAQWDDTIPTYPLELEKQGYHIGFTYKVWSPGNPKDAPYGGKKNGYHPGGRAFNGFSQYVEKRTKAGDSLEKSRRHLLDEVKTNFASFLKARENDKTPFCYWWGPTNCHRKWIQGSGKAHWGLDPEALKGKLPAFLPDVPVVREDFCDYLGEVQAFDAGLGVLLTELERINQLENTIVVVSGDHGIPGFPNGKCNLYDFGVAVPLAIRWPQKIAPGRVVSDFVSLPDLAPTFLEFARAPVPDSMSARSLFSILTSTKQGRVEKERSFVITGRERHVAAARENRMPYPQRAIRTDDYLYIRNFKPDRWPMGTGPPPGKPMPEYTVLRDNTFAAFGDFDASPTKAWIATNKGVPGTEKYYRTAFGKRPEEELYDLKNDPDQIKNIAAASNHADVRKRLSRQLEAALRSAKDPRIEGDPCVFDRAPFANEPQARRP